MATGSVTPDASGNFAYFTTASALGTVMAVATHSGFNSAPVYTTITCAPPLITTFQVIHGANGSWTFRGTVQDPAPAGLVIQFSGNPYVNGLTAVVDQNGFFSATFYLPQLTSGFVSAQCWDVWGQSSNIVTDPLT
jgi:hypothetical protein